MLDNEKLTVEEMSDVRKAALNLARVTKKLPKEQRVYIVGLLKGLSSAYEPPKE